MNVYGRNMLCIVRALTQLPTYLVILGQHSTLLTLSRLVRVTGRHPLPQIPSESSGHHHD
jgi:hypothetical protein